MDNSISQWHQRTQMPINLLHGFILIQEILGKKLMFSMFTEMEKLNRICFPHL